MVKKITLALLSLLLVPLGMMAQNVTISPNNGNMICALTEGSPTSQIGFRLGSFGSWIHEQLPLTMTGSNDTDLTGDGQLLYHSNHFTSGDKCVFDPALTTPVTEAEAKNFISAAWGGTGYGISPGYITIALPKGYRFTKYRFLLSHDITGLKSDATYKPVKQYDFYMTETGSSFNDTKNSVTIPTVKNGKAEVVEFTRTGNDMGNVLYFKTTAAGPGYCELNFRHVELEFTADADASIDVKPNTVVTSGVSMLEVPFNTGKVDFGQIERYQYDGADRYCYRYNAVGDMSANMLLYEFESVRDADLTQGESYDGTSGKIAYNKGGSITTVGDYFKLDPGSSKEQVYILETPVFATSKHGEKNPIQFRIVGANVEYDDGSDIKKSYQTYTIRGRYSNSGSWIYMAPSSGTTTSGTYHWYLDENGHMRCGDNGEYYLMEINHVVNPYNPENFVDAIITTTTDVSEATKFKIVNNQYLQIDGGEHDNWYVRYQNTFSGQYYWRAQSTSVTQTAQIKSTGQTEIRPIATDPAGFTLKVYDATGENLVATKTVDSSNKTGNVPLTGLNNDAIKFSVQGTGYVKLNVTLQALNPYVDQMSVVMNDAAKNLRMTQTFTSDDFSVGGDTFLFYLPTGCRGDNITMTFEDLYSSYGDDTYDHTTETGNSDSRYNYVMSQHYQAFTDDNIYNGKAEAASDVKESVRIANKQNVRTQVGTVGNRRFRFNNADVLSTQSGWLEEYPFTKYNYEHQTNPGAGNFELAEFKSIGTNDASKTFYVFTTDETKYNIAPTTATQHRSYAFYEMEVQLICADYSPTVTFEKIYSNSFNETGKTEFYGANVSALVGGSQGLAADFAVNKAIAQKIATGGTDIPASMDQILYLDMSNLKGVFHSDATKQEDKQYEVADFNVLKSKLAKNALVFLPINSTSTFDNFAYALKGQTESSLTFKAANNIILTDKNPFYTPYTIQVDAAKSARYTRQITKSTYSGEAYATVIMPFEISLVDGQHVDEYGTLEFLQMNEKNATADDYNYMGKTIFFSKTNASKVEANTPYALHVVENKGTDGAFTVNQKGSNIIATPEAAKSGNTLFSATKLESTGNLTDKNNNKSKYTFSHKGSFSGYKIPRENPKTFYFANNGFYSSVELKSYYTTVDLYPFRSVYEVTNIEGGGNAKVGFLRFVEGENDSETDGIDVLKATSEVDMNAPVYDMQGRMIAPTYREAKSLQSGMYVVNGVKIIVK